MRNTLVTVLALSAWLAVAPLPAQDALPAPRSAAPYLSSDEWSRAALRQLHALGLLPAAHDPSLWSIDRAETMVLFAEAVDRAETDRTAALPLARGFADRFAAEHSEVAAGAGVPAPKVGAGALFAGAGYRSSRGDMHVALGAPDFPEAPPAPLPDINTPVALVDASGYVGRRISGRLRVAAEGGGGDVGVRLDELYLVIDAEVARAWAGRKPVGIGLPERGVILRGTAAVDGVGADVHAFRLPWILEHLGPIRASTALGRIGRVEPFDAPWLWTLRANLQPHERLAIGLNRGAMVGPPDDEDANWLKQVTFVLIGKHSDELNRHDNQIASVDLVFRPPLGALPLVTYLEWGAEDSAGAWWDVPGVVFGGYLGAVPGVPWLAAGVERASFAKSCCGNPWWYRHRGFAAGWTSDGSPLAHPLGGHGQDTRARLDATLARARVLIGADVYGRERGSENLYAPTREGSTIGAAARLSALIETLPIDTPLRLELDAEHERGSDWTRTLLALRAALVF